MLQVHSKKENVEHIELTSFHYNVKHKLESVKFEINQDFLNHLLKMDNHRFYNLLEFDKSVSQERLNTLKKNYINTYKELTTKYGISRKKQGREPRKPLSAVLTDTEYNNLTVLLNELNAVKKSLGKKYKVRMTLLQALTYKFANHIRFSIYLDSRGRIYYHNNNISSQAAAVGRNCIQFKKKGNLRIEDGNEEFKIAGSLLFYGKMASQGGKTFVRNNKELLSLFSKNPLEDSLPEKAAEPLDFLN